jgi:2-polyprenyl-3-methyl-5-hydroxy-6-metoxy-1,4-benzoquinol methylase
MRNRNIILLKKVIRTLLNPLRWGVIGKRATWLVRTNLMLLRNSIESRRFSSNPNTRAYWNKKLGRLGSSWRDDHYHHIMDLLPAGGEFSLLDLGCALGDGCELLKKRFPKAAITGVDISEVGIQKAREKRMDIQYEVLDILSDPIPDDFDYITIVETLEHFDEPYDVLDKCLKHARESVIICVPYRQNLPRMLRWGQEHRFSYDERSFDRYKSRVVCVTRFLKDTGNKCIIYEIKPS